MKLLGRWYGLLLRLMGTPDIVVFGFHLHDLFQTDSIGDLPRPYRMFHGRNAGNALERLERFLGLLREAGYAFCNMRELAERTAKG